MIIEKIENIKEWDKFVIAQKEHSFLHSWAWGEVQKKTEEDIIRVGVYDGKELLAVSLIIVVRAKRGAFLFVPHGPIFKDGVNKKDILKILSDFFVEEAKKLNVLFARVSFLLEENEENNKMINELDVNYKDAPIYMHAENTWFLKLDKSEDELLMDMRKTARNLIRRAKKEGVEIESKNSKENLDVFMKLYTETVKKHKFTPFSKKFIKTEIEEFENMKKKGIGAKLYVAKWQGHILSSAIVIHYGHSAYYHHGANSSKHIKIPSSYALQWQAILDAKKAGKDFYNFWGVTKSTSEKHPWAGLTKFKKGFGGEGKDYIHAKDIPVSFKYIKPRAVDYIRMFRRNH